MLAVDIFTATIFNNKSVYIYISFPFCTLKDMAVYWVNFNALLVKAFNISSVEDSGDSNTAAALHKSYRRLMQQYWQNCWVKQEKISPW